MQPRSSITVSVAWLVLPAAFVFAARIKGNIRSMSLVSTVLRNADGYVVTVPNSSIWGGPITNHGIAA